jgi:hypothetical protein
VRKSESEDESDEKMSRVLIPETVHCWPTLNQRKIATKTTTSRPVQA